MKILFTILYLFFGALAGSCTQPDISNNLANENSAYYADITSHNQATLQANLYVDQDSNESNDFLLYFIDLPEVKKPIPPQTISEAFCTFDFYQIHFSILLIDLPPPARS
ncbi:hypothetical protein [uncultured Draconibacterium sp.]|uniref:hypothetical protein n=1 Tax=uncultured Draconibacterium sp. TaxID=1573823 RepID=UPI003217E7DA